VRTCAGPHCSSLLTQDSARRPSPHARWGKPDLNSTPFRTSVDHMWQEEGLEPLKLPSPALGADLSCCWPCVCVRKPWAPAPGLKIHIWCGMLRGCRGWSRDGSADACDDAASCAGDERLKSE